MGEAEKLLVKILRGTSDTNTPFDGLCKLLKKLDFDERIKGSHHIFSKPGVEEILNPQPRDGGKARPCQVKQVRSVIVKCRLGGEDES